SRSRARWGRRRRSRGRRSVAFPCRENGGPERAVSPSPRLPRRLAPLAEERAQQLRRGLVLDAGDDLDLMVQPLVLRDRVERARRAELLVERAEDEPRQPRQDERAGAHRARFERDVERAAVEELRAGGLARGREREHLRVRRRVTETLDGVATAPDEHAVPDNDGADGDLALLEGALGLAERLPHPAPVRVEQCAETHA